MSKINDDDDDDDVDVDVISAVCIVVGDVFIDTLTTWLSSSSLYSNFTEAVYSNVQSYC